MPSLYNEMVSRNIGIFSSEEQNFIKKARIGIAGVGGVGGLLAERLIRLGVMNISITDPGTFEQSNLNRQFGCTSKSIGKNKAHSVACLLKEINPELSINSHQQGITDQSSAYTFILSSDIIIDEMDYGLFNQSVFLQKAAKQQNKIYIFSTAVGYGAYVCVFHPKGITLEEYNNSSIQTNPIKTQPVLAIDKVLPYIPKYVKPKIGLIEQMIRGEKSVSNNSIGVGLTSILTAHIVTQIILSSVTIPLDKPLQYIIDLQDGHISRNFIDTR